MKGIAAAIDSTLKPPSSDRSAGDPRAYPCYCGAQPELKLGECLKGIHVGGTAGDIS